MMAFGLMSCANLNLVTHDDLKQGELVRSDVSSSDPGLSKDESRDFQRSPVVSPSSTKPSTSVSVKSPVFTESFTAAENLNDIIRAQEQLLQTLISRVDSLEHWKKTLEAENSDPASKQELYEKALVELEEQTKKMQQEMLRVKAKQANLAILISQKNKKKQSPKNVKTPFSKGEKAFKEKRFLDAIEYYQAYRKRYPLGSRYVQATFKLGLALIKSKEKKAARPFMEEVLRRFPNSKEAKKAQKYL